MYRIILNQKTTIIAAIGTAVLLYIAHLAGFWAVISAHPLWSASATYFGIGAGMVMVVLTGQKQQWGTLVLLLLLTALALQTSYFGKVEFVGSYAENRFAGRIWYYGFIAFISGAHVSIVVLARNLFTKKPDMPA